MRFVTVKLFHTVRKRPAFFEGIGDVGWGRWRCIMPHGSDSGSKGQVRQAGINKIVREAKRKTTFLVLVCKHFLKSSCFTLNPKTCVTDMVYWIPKWPILICTNFGSDKKPQKNTLISWKRDQENAASHAKLPFYWLTKQFGRSVWSNPQPPFV